MSAIVRTSGKGLDPYFILLCFMAPDNDNVAAPSGTVTKTPRQSSGKWRNLIVVSGILGLVASGYIGFGVGIRFEERPVGTPSGSRVQSNIVVPIIVIESSTGAFANGGSGDVISGFTPDGTLLIQSGALMIGPDRAPNIVLSGSTLLVRGAMSGAVITLKPTTGSSAIVIQGGAKGSHLCVRDTDGAGWTSVDTLNGTVTARIASAGECP